MHYCAPLIHDTFSGTITFLALQSARLPARTKQRNVRYYKALQIVQEMQWSTIQF